MGVQGRGLHFTRDGRSTFSVVFFYRPWPSAGGFSLVHLSFRVVYSVYSGVQGVHVSVVSNEWVMLHHTLAVNTELDEKVPAQCFYCTSFIKQTLLSEYLTLLENVGRDVAI